MFQGFCEDSSRISMSQTLKWSLASQALLSNSQWCDHELWPLTNQTRNSLSISTLHNILQSNVSHHVATSHIASSLNTSFDFPDLRVMEIPIVRHVSFGSNDQDHFVTFHIASSINSFLSNSQSAKRWNGSISYQRSRFLVDPTTQIFLQFHVSRVGRLGPSFLWPFSQRNVDL